MRTYLNLSFFLITVLCTQQAYGAETIKELKELIEANHLAHQDSLNHIWTMVAAALVMVMQGGFLLLEAGMSRSKNSINVAQKNIIDFIIAIVVFYIFGFAVMFGITNGGWFGWSSELSFFSTTEEWNYTFFIFQAVFAGTAGTIVSGAVAERMKLSGYIFITFLIGILIYPVIGHWGWGNLLHSSNDTYLTKNGFIDFAGSTIVHSVGAWVALAACIVLGPRIGRFDPKTEKTNRMEGHSLVLSTMGCIILWVGWIGFNGGSTTVGSSGFAHIVFNTMIAGSFGGAVAIIVGRLTNGYFMPDQAINGVLGGLVAITAGCDAVEGLGAAFIGASAGLVMLLANCALTRYAKIDDVVSAIPVHGFCGAWGTIMVAFFATEEKLGGATIWQQFSIQAQGVIIAFIWAFGISFIFCKLIDTFIGIRVSAEDELEGLNSAEHKSSLGLGTLQKCLQDVVEGSHDLTQRIDIERGDESEEIARYINKFIDQIHTLVKIIHKEAGILHENSTGMSEISSHLAASSEEISIQSNEVTSINRDMASESTKIAELADNMGKRINNISESADNMSTNVEQVSQAIYDLTKSIGKVEQESHDVSHITNEAKLLTEQASATVINLSEAASAIFGVVELIKNIASQTNLLALNATIESSRAGEAGKGFAVVAHEVKELANQTAKATEEIESRIDNIKISSTDTATIINDVTKIIFSINDAITNISTLTKEQNSTATKIVSNVSETTDATRKVRDSINEITDSTNDIFNGIKNTASNADHIHSIMQNFSKEAAESSSNAQSTKDASYKIQSVSESVYNEINKYKIDNTKK